MNEFPITGLMLKLGFVSRQFSPSVCAIVPYVPPTEKCDQIWDGSRDIIVILGDWTVGDWGWMR